MIPRPLGRLAYRGAYLGLRAWSMVARPHTRGVKCVVWCGDAVLLVRHAYGPGDWDLPGGFARRGEPAEATARRELREELGAEAAKGFTELGAVHQRRHGRHEEICGVGVELVGPDLEPRGFELREAGWFSPLALPEPRAEVADRILALDERFASF